MYYIIYTARQDTLNANPSAILELEVLYEDL